MPSALEEKQKSKINLFIDLAVDFNKTHNIFSRKTNDEVFKKDIIDCKPILNHIPTNHSVLDLGSGGGFPGLLISIMMPENKITLVESSSKKCYFLRTVVDKLLLENTTILNERIIENNDIGPFDIITARAFAKTKKILELTKKNTKKDSKYILLKGKEETIIEELKDIDKNLYMYEIIKLELKPEERNIILLKRNE